MPAPRQNTTVNKLETGIPTARAIWLSSTPARIMAPRRVRSSRKYSAIAAPMAQPTSTSRKVGKTKPNTRVGDCKFCGVGTGIGAPPHSMKHASEMMKDMPSVTSTCPNGLVFSRVSTSRSKRPPITATAIPAPSAATQIFNPSQERSAVAPKYVPSMKKAPCVRFATLISPKISENPDDSRNNRPPSDRLLRPWMIQNCIVCRSCLQNRQPAIEAELLLQVFCRRIVARINRILQKCDFVIGPELTHVRVGFDNGIDQPPIAPRY